MKTRIQFATALLAAVSFAAASLMAQDVSSPVSVTVIAGDDAAPRAPIRTPQQLAVRVENAQHQALSGTLVSFSLPYSGAGGVFLDGLKTLQVTTDANGIAIANGFYRNANAGPFEIRVVAMSSSQAGYATIREVNAGAHRAVSRRTWWIVAGGVVAAGAAGGTYAALRHGKSSSTSISAGGVTVGAPH